MNPLALKKALAYILTLLVLVATFVFCVGLLPIVQTAVFPSPPLGGWLIKPIYAILFAAAAVTTCLLAPFLLWPIRRMLRDAGYQPKPIKLHVMIVTCLTFLIHLR